MEVVEIALPRTGVQTLSIIHQKFGECGAGYISKDALVKAHCLFL